MDNDNQCKKIDGTVMVINSKYVLLKKYKNYVS